MSRHLWNLERLCRKLQARLGDDDAFTLQVQREIESRRVIETQYPAQPVTRPERFVPRAAERRRDAASANPT
jgi:hypothetical protein